MSVPPIGFQQWHDTYNATSLFRYYETSQTVLVESGRVLVKSVMPYKPYPVTQIFNPPVMFATMLNCRVCVAGGVAFESVFGGPYYLLDYRPEPITIKDAHPGDTLLISEPDWVQHGGAWLDLGDFTVFSVRKVDWGSQAGTVTITRDTVAEDAWTTNPRMKLACPEALPVHLLARKNALAQWEGKRPETRVTAPPVPVTVGAKDTLF